MDADFVSLRGNDGEPVQGAPKGVQYGAARYGVGPDDRVVIAMPNRVERTCERIRDDTGKARRFLLRQQRLLSDHQ